MATPAPELFDGVHIVYPPGVSWEQQYGFDREEHTAVYLGSIVAPRNVLGGLLHPDVLRIDGAVDITSDSATVQNIAVAEGREPYLDFRGMVNSLASPNGEVTGVWLPEDAWAPLQAQVEAQVQILRPGYRLGSLVAAAAAEFPYELRNNPASPPLTIPPHRQHLIRPGETFPPIRALNDPGHPEYDRHTVRALQVLFADPETGLITARIGLVWDDPGTRDVPFAIHDEHTKVRAGQERKVQTAQEVVRLLRSQVA